MPVAVNSVDCKALIWDYTGVLAVFWVFLWELLAAKVGLNKERSCAARDGSS